MFVSTLNMFIVIVASWKGIFSSIVRKNHKKINYDGEKKSKKWSDLLTKSLDDRYKEASFYEKNFYNFCSVMGVILMLVGLYAIFWN